MGGERDDEPQRLLGAAAAAFADRQYADATVLYQRALTAWEAPDADYHDYADVLLDLARSQLNAGRVEDSWQTCLSAAQLGRRHDDHPLMADAATLINPTRATSMAGQIHRLGIEALARGIDLDPVRRSRLLAQVEATQSPWGPPDIGDAGRPRGSEDPASAETTFLKLQAEHTRLLHVEHVAARLALADAAMALGADTGTEEYLASGLFWRMEALSQLSNRVVVEDELAVFADLVRRMRQPHWDLRLTMVRASSAALDGRFDDCRALVAEGLRRSPGVPSAAFMALVTRSNVAVLTGEGLDAIEGEVREALQQVPFLARAWHALVLVALDRLDEAADIWAAIAPHVSMFSRQAPEWLIACVGNAQLCVALGDTDTAGVLHAELLPYAGYQAIASADTPSEGPVDLHLGRLALLRGELDAADRHLVAALSSSRSMHALAFVAQSHLELARLRRLQSREAEAAEHVSAALVLGRRLGLSPLIRLAETLTGAPDRPGPLSRRELEIAGLVAGGLSNRAIAERLVISERTVENHVSRILHKTGHTSRAGVAAWFVSR